MRRFRRWLHIALCATSALCGLMCVLWRTTQLRPTIRWVEENATRQTCIVSRGPWLFFGAIGEDYVVAFSIRYDDVNIETGTLAAPTGQKDLPNVGVAGLRYRERVGAIGDFPCVTSDRVKWVVPSGLLHAQYEPVLTAVEKRIAMAPLRFRVLTVPLWMLACGFFLLPASAILRGPLRRWYRRATERCERCAYDLTANVSGACPECGTRLPAPRGRVTTRAAYMLANRRLLVRGAVQRTSTETRQVVRIAIAGWRPVVAGTMRGGLLGTILALSAFAVQSHESWGSFVRPGGRITAVLLPGTMLGATSIPSLLWTGAAVYGILVAGLTVLRLATKAERPERCQRSR